MAARLRTILATAAVAVLVVAGLAIAKSAGNGSDNGSGDNGSAGARVFRAPFPGPIGPPPFIRDLTYAELHTQRDGKDVVVRLDRGEVKSVDSDSITITENDGSDVTIPVDSETHVLVFPPKRGANLSDLSEGDKVVVDRDEGAPARAILEAPKPGDMLKRSDLPAPRGHRFELPAPPPRGALPIPPG
jgi:hypothetical protein